MFRRWLGRAVLRLCGWRADMQRPSEAKYVLIATPHTSNWDLLFMLAGTYAIGVQVAWLGKHTLFRPPLGWLLRFLGGIPIDRRAARGAVGQMIDVFNHAERLVVAVPPEGTRKRTEYWKSGFYHMAAGARVPICLGFLDYEKKLCGLGPLITPSGDIRADMDRIRAFYRDIRGRYPENAGTPRLREEDEAHAKSGEAAPGPR